MTDHRTVENGRLAYYRESADNPEFWTAHWAGVDIAKTLDVARSGYLGDYADVFLNHLPKGDPILEAGCGFGRYVLALQARGYNVTGVEFSAETVERAGWLAPDMDIRVGNILALDYPDGHFGAYISLGVVEHFREGPGPALREACRVIAPGGIVICSVPYFNPFRRRKSHRQSPNGGAPPTSDFYQYAFTESEIAGILQAHGLYTEKAYYHGLAKGLKDEIGWVEKFQKLHPLCARCLWHTGRIPWVLPRYFAHMVTLVARKADGRPAC